MKILFVCTANICRSVISEAVFQKIVSEENLGLLMNTESAGTESLVGMTPNESTVEVCAEHGLDVRKHRSQQLSREMLEQASIIFCLAETHREVINGAFPQFKSKVALLKEFGQPNLPSNLSVDDPVGKPKKNYDICYAEIEQELRRIFPLIKSAAMKEKHHRTSS